VSRLDELRANSSPAARIISAASRHLDPAGEVAYVANGPLNGLFAPHRVVDHSVDLCHMRLMADLAFAKLQEGNHMLDPESVWLFRAVLLERPHAGCAERYDRHKKYPFDLTPTGGATKEFKCRVLSCRNLSGFAPAHCARLAHCGVAAWE
tara:strand:- start:2180 stop:2632 length:453 start_codon:yes stop_codon:yes gene_type:complete